MEEVDPFADEALEGLRLEGRDELEKEKKELLHQILLAYTRHAKASDTGMACG